MLDDKFIIKRVHNSFEITNITPSPVSDCLILIRNIYSASTLRWGSDFAPGETKVFPMYDYWFDNFGIDKRFYAKVYSNHKLVYEKIINDKTKCFVLLSNKEFESLTEQLIIGLTRYSNVDILHYTIDYKSSLSYNNLTNIEFSIKGDSTDRAYMQFAKPSILLDVIERGYQNGVFLDSDIQVRSNIEDLFKYTIELEDSPIFNKGVWDFTYANGVSIPGPLLTEALGGIPAQYAPQGITNILIFNKTHKNLFKEWEDACFSEKVISIKGSEFMHDELILNCLLWKKGIIPNQKYLAINVKELEDVDFFYNHEYSTYSDINMTEHGKGWVDQSIIPYDRESITCFHYVKDVSTANYINNLIYKMESHPVDLEFDPKKEIVVILSHSDTERKLEHLAACVNEIKEQGYPIIISSHIDIPSNYYDEVDYVIIDKDNPVIDNSNKEYSPDGLPFTYFRDDSYYHVSYTRYNYAFAVIKLMKAAAGVAYSNGYSKIHFVNYDYELKDDLVLKKHSYLLNIYDVVGYHDNLGKRSYINTGLFSVTIKKFIDSLKDVSSSLDFVSHGQIVLEEFMYYHFLKNGLNIENSNHIGILKPECVINKEATHKGIVDGYYGSFHLYFTKEEATDTYYITSWADIGDYKKIIIGVDGKEFIVYSLPFNQKTIIDVTSIIKDGKEINVSVPDYKFEDKYTIESDTSLCEIYDRSIVKQLLDINNIENMKNKLEEKYEEAMLTKPDNISEHLPTLKRYAEECEHVTEMGVDRVISTYALMMGRPKKMFSYDIVPVESHGVDRNYLKALAQENGIDFTFVVTDTTELEIEETDLLFIDTEHNYLQLKTELLLHANKVKKYIIFHDTVTYGTVDSNYYGHYTKLKEIDPGDKDKQGLLPAISEFLEKNKNWVIHETYTNCNGLMIIKNADFFKDKQAAVGTVTRRTFKEISDSFDCDKSTYHKYDKIYPDFLEKFRDASFNLFEIGIEAGKSYKIWQEYFPNANIYGMDIGVSFKTERGEVFIGDQSSIDDLHRVASNIAGKCKFILDDGSHIPEHQLKSFYYLFENLLDYGGVYIIEDIECSYWRPKSALYGYDTGHLNIIDYFTKLNHDVNSHYSLGKNDLHIKSITFAANCIIVTKKTELDIIEDNRNYRFSECVLNDYRLC